MTEEPFAPNRAPFLIAGCILAGGQSRRMGGGDKALLELAGRPLIAHVIERLARQVSRMVLNANGDARRFDAFGLPVVADAMDGFVGPLAGILAGLRWAEANVPQCTHVVTVSGDAPFLPDDLVARFAEAIAGEPARIAIASTGGQPQPVIGLWPLSIADDLEASLNAGARGVLAWCTQRNARHVEFPASLIAGRTIDPFFNANTPLELAEARLILQRQHFHSPVIGVAGWKNSGKTTLVTRLVETLTARGNRVSTIKFSHHEGPVDDADRPSARVRDTTRHTMAGAKQVGFASPSRWSILEGGATPVEWHTSGADREVVLSTIISAMTPADVILLEGYKAAAIPKIEVRRAAQPDTRNLEDTHSYIFAIAADHVVEAKERWVVGLDDVDAIADQIERIAGLQKERGA